MEGQRISRGSDTGRGNFLDIDFDVLFTEIAPIDAITQRLGRINRSKDPYKVGEVYIETCIEAETKNGKWVYPYKKS